MVLKSVQPAIPPANQTTSFLNTMITPELITICNDGRKIAATNYWGTKQARAGVFLVSVNAGEARLLVPRVMLPFLDDLIRDVKSVVISTGYWRQVGRRHAVEWLAEDGSGTPFFLLVGPDETHGLGQVPRGEIRQMTASVWVEGPGGPEMRGEFPAYLRSVSELPCLRKID